MADKLKKAIRALCTPEMISYVFFGVCTTIVNIVVFQCCTIFLHWNWSMSNVLAWLAAVLFAFVTNKLFVFRSKDVGAKLFLWEAVTFFGARVLSLGVDMASMWLLLDYMHLDGFLAKIIVSVLVIIVNYILSKRVIFRRNS